mmetsp:Transcript_53922/g.128441  ORF Transcript_53922/g.128441 Transcript_53922/m.128441 type:complete len:283 (+) Transcript_53922:74-922(+)
MAASGAEAQSPPPKVKDSLSATAGSDEKVKKLSSSTPALPALNAASPANGSASSPELSKSFPQQKQRMPPLASMPQRKGRRKEAMQDRNWQEMEAVKGRLASAIDRAEYLATSRNRLTDLAGTHGDDLWKSLRHRREFRYYMNRTLQSTEAVVDDILQEQRQLMEKNKTAKKRMAQLNKYVYDSEAREVGPEGLEAAKASARKASPAKTDYPNYDDLSAFTATSSGVFRPPPILAVKGRMPYRPPKEAVVHGWKGAKHYRSPGHTAREEKLQLEDDDQDDDA